MTTLKFEKTPQLQDDYNILLWEQKIDATPNIRRILPSDYIFLTEQLADAQDRDTYLNSAAYYLFTGRNGLWLYTFENAHLLLCWHPNRPGNLLLFPAVNDQDHRALSELLKSLPAPPNGLRLVRIKTDSGDQIATQLMLNDQVASAIHIAEDILDWTYPVRILSTDAVSLTRGNKFRNVRKGLIHAQSHNIRMEPLNWLAHQQGINFLLHNWASRADTREEYFTLYETYSRLFMLSADDAASLDGLVCFIDNKIEAVSLWDVQQSQNGQPAIANAYANFCDTHVNGLAETFMVGICQMLASKNISLLNLGGSETESLDFFKNKFRPAISIDLCSIDIDLVPREASIQTSAERYA